jgi:hypothetical protein
MTSPSGSEAKTTLVSFFGFFLYNEDMAKGKLSKPTKCSCRGGDVGTGSLPGSDKCGHRE